MRIKLSACVAIAIASLTAIAVAQGPGGPGRPGGPGGPGMGRKMDPAAFMKMMHQREDGMYAKIHVTSSQKKQLMALRADNDSKMMAIFKSGQRPDRTKMKAMRDAHDAKLQKILSKAQFTQLQQLRQQMRGQRGGMRGGPGGPGMRGPGGPGAPGHA